MATARLGQEPRRVQQSTHAETNGNRRQPSARCQRQGRRRWQHPARLQHAGRAEILQTQWLLLHLRAGWRGRKRLAKRVPFKKCCRPLRRQNRIGTRAQQHQRAASGRLGTDTGRRRLVLPFSGQKGLRTHRPSATHGLAKRLARHRPDECRNRHRRAGAAMAHTCRDD